MKSCSSQPVHNMRKAAHHTPEHPGSVVFDHHHNRSLIKTIVTLRNPTLSLASALRKSGVVAALESVFTRHLGIVLIDALKRRKNYFGSEWQRGCDGPRRQRAVVGTVRNRTPNVIVKTYGSSPHMSNCRTRAV